MSDRRWQGAWRWPKRRFGYSDLGRPHIPPQPAFVQMVDRDTGLRWTLKINAAADHLVIDDADLPGRFRNHTHLYDAFLGPLVLRSDGVTIRMLVRAGRPAYEQVETAPGDDYTRNPLVRGRRDFLRTWLHFTIPASYVREGDRIAMDSFSA